MTDFFDRCPKCGGIVRRGSQCARCAQAAPVRPQQQPVMAAAPAASISAGTEITCPACGTLNTVVPTLNQTRCGKCGVDLVGGALVQPPARPGTAAGRGGPVATKIVILLLVIPFLLMIAVVLNAGMYALSAPATIAFDVVIVIAVVYDIRRIIQQRRRIGPS